MANSKVKKINFWAKSCLGKKSFKTNELAESFANKKTPIFKTKYRIYYCNLCSDYHLTKNGKIKELQWNSYDEVKPNEEKSIKLKLENGNKIKVFYKNNKFFSKKTGKEITNTILQWKYTE